MQITITGVPEHFNFPWILAENSPGFRHIVDFRFQEEGAGSGAMIEHLASGVSDYALLLTESAVWARKTRGYHIVASWVQSPLAWGLHYSARPEQPPNANSFAISRPFSGSHLMAYHWAQQSGVDPAELSFQQVGNMLSGFKALDQGTSQYFLWEKFTSRPMLIGDRKQAAELVEAPWPAFCFVAKEAQLERDKALVALASQVLDHFHREEKREQTRQQMASRHGLELEELAEWRQNVRWSVEAEAFFNTLESVEKFISNIEDKI